MADAKIEIRVGAFSFTGEGTEKWLSSELAKLLAKIPELVAVAPAEPAGDGGNPHNTRPNKPGKPGTLAAFLKTKNATSSQVKKFLATAIWLHDTTGKNRLETGDVVEALNKNSQGKLTNAGQCLINNATKGHAEKDGGRFYVTDEGRQSFGA